MKTLVLFILILATSSFYSQSELEVKLLEKYPAEKVANIMSQNNLKKYYQQLVFNSYKLTKVETNKATQLALPKLTGVNKTNKQKQVSFVSAQHIVNSIKNNSFNILLIDIKRDMKEKKTYLLENTNYTLTILPHKALQQK